MTPLPTRPMRLPVIAIVISILMGPIPPLTHAAEPTTRRPTRIAPQELALALQQLAKDRDVQLVYRSELVADRRTDGASGVLTLDEALIQLLRGSGLVYRYLGAGAVTLVREE